MDIKSKEIKLDLENGETVGLTLNFKKLLELRNKRKEDYKNYNDVIANGLKDGLQAADVLYAAYLCGSKNMDEAMEKDEFLEAMPPYPMYCIDKALELMRPKKRTDSEQPL